MIDMHCHLLAGIDDGPASVEDSLQLARALVDSGISKVLATPHVSWHYQNDAATIARLRAQLSDLLLEQKIALEVIPGGEIAMTYALELSPAEIKQFGLGGGPWLLIEPPFTAVVNNMDAILMDLQRSGQRILLAHPERCPAFHRDPKMLGTLVRAGVLTSITAGALVGRFGSQVRRFALEMAREEMIHNVASDAHDRTNRPPGIRAELEEAGLAPLTQWLTEAVPGAILSDQQIPPRPAVALALAKTPRRPRWRRPSLRRAS
ncbi:MAG TPA: CpsB/CapC family capsule biosynthesis tyrosine phosphatase [Solirubrobacteraceae bacterium]|jgi:protein-tyrosine phosphatase